MLKPVKKLSPIDAAKAEVLAATQALELEREKEKAITARVEANRKTEYAARETLSRAHARYNNPFDLADMDQAAIDIDTAKREIAAIEREALPLKRLLENAQSETRLAFEVARSAKQAQWQVEFDAKRLELQSQFPDAKNLREAFGYWLRAGHPSQTGNPWGSFLVEIAGPLTQSEIDRAYEAVEG